MYNDLCDMAAFKIPGTLADTVLGGDVSLLCMLACLQIYVCVSFRAFFDHSMHSALPLGIYLATKFWMYTTWFYWFWNDILC